MNEKIETELKRISKTTLKPSEALNSALVNLGTTPVETGVRFLELLKRPQVDYKTLIRFDDSEEAPDYPRIWPLNWKYGSNTKVILTHKTKKLCSSENWKKRSCL